MWRCNSDYFPRTSPCNTRWKGIVCDTYAVGGNIIGISFPFVGIGGSIPLQLWSLTSLRYLDLSMNDMSGTIPDSVGQLTALEFINLSGNQLEGSIPTGVGSMLSLQYFIITNTPLQGTLPTTLSLLNKLAGLIITNTLIGGTLPVLENLPLIRILDLSTNFFTGTIPSSFGALSKYFVL